MARSENICRASAVYYLGIRRVFLCEAPYLTLKYVILGTIGCGIIGHPLCPSRFQQPI